MTHAQVNARTRPSILLVLAPPTLFLIKDIIATFVVLSYEPGITERAVNNYALHLLPGSLFVITGRAIPLNIGFGFLVGVALYSFFYNRSRARAAKRE